VASGVSGGVTHEGSGCCRQAGASRESASPPPSPLRVLVWLHTGGTPCNPAWADARALSHRHSSPVKQFKQVASSLFLHSPCLQPPPSAAGPNTTDSSSPAERESCCDGYRYAAAHTRQRSCNHCCPCLLPVATHTTHASLRDFHHNRPGAAARVAGAPALRQAGRGYAAAAQAGRGGQAEA
jgi:hypothetical protein